MDMSKMKDFRTSMGLNKKQLAILCKVSLNTITSWEDEIGTPSPENMKKLESALMQRKD